jgi:hypothetical protein
VAPDGIELGDGGLVDLTNYASFCCFVSSFRPVFSNLRRTERARFDLTIETATITCNLVGKILETSNLSHLCTLQNEFYLACSLHDSKAFLISS